MVSADSSVDEIGGYIQKEVLADTETDQIIRSLDLFAFIQKYRLSL